MRSLGIVAIVLASAGCVQVPSTTSHASPAVKLGGCCLELEGGARPTTETFVRKIETHLAARHLESARGLIRRFPDLAEACLQSQSTPTIEFIRAEQQPLHKRHVAAADALLKCENARGAGRAKVAADAWRIAMRTAGDEPPLRDPNLWTRMATQRPDDADWPAEIIGRLMNSLVEDDALMPSEGPAEFAVWAFIGQLRLDRGEPKGALAAFEKAETFAAGRCDAARLSQARALIGLDQSPAAITILAGLAESGSPPYRRAALATLGACKFRDGHVGQALVFLKKAVEESTELFPGRADAEADLGLAYLSIDNERAGLLHLHAAQQSPSIRPASRELVFENEAAYLRHVGRSTEAALIEARLQERPVPH